ncbi:MAG: BPSS1780 family membrane protein [Caldimonas sp.]
MKLQIVSPRQGLVWVQKAFRVFARQPLGFAALFATCLFVVLLLGLVPIIGTIALLMLPPAGSLLFMVASRRVGDGKTAMPGSIAELASAGRQRLLALLKLGFAYAAATFALFSLAGVLDGGALEAFLDALPDAKTSPESAATSMADPQLQLGLILRLLFAALLSIPFWHAPALVHWGNHGWAKSLFFSSVAVWRNRGAFIVYGAAWVGLWVLLLAFVSIGVGLFGPQRFTLVATPLTLVFSTIFYASLWFTFADCFSSDEPPSSGEGADSPDALTKGSP